MASPLLRRSTRNRKIDDDDDENGNGEKNKNKKKVPPPNKSSPLSAAAAAAAAEKKKAPHHLHAKKKKAPAQPVPVPVSALPVLLSHPYMEINYPKRIPTIEQIQRMEDSVLLKLIDRSKWRSYPSGPQQCYEKSNIDFDFDFPFTNANANANLPPKGSGSRITHLKIIDNTFYERLQLILAFRDAAAQANNANARINHVQLPRIVGPRPLWRMTKDIAIMDRLKVIELYRCTGQLPKSMNYLNRLTRLQLDGCRDIDLSLLGLAGCGTHTTPSGGGSTFDTTTTSACSNNSNMLLRNLIELKITDCENLTPIKFQNLSNLKRITLMRWDKSNNNTINLGKRWINELSLANVTTTEASTTTASLVALMNGNNNNNVPLPSDEQQQPVLPVPVQALPMKIKFQFRYSLQYLTFSGSRLTNKDLKNILFDMLYDNKFPNLDTLVINDNPEINSFKEVLQLQQQQHNAAAAAAAAAPTSSTMTKRTNLKTLKLSGTRIKVNNEELDSVIYFLDKLYPTIGIMKVFSYDSCKGKDGVVSFRENGLAITHIHNKRMIFLPSDQRKKINKIEYLLSMNSTNAFSMTGGRGRGRGGGGTRNTTIPGDYIVPIAAAAAAAATTTDSTENEDGRHSFGSSEEVGASASASVSASVSASASASASTTDHHHGGGGVLRQRQTTIPLSVYPLALSKSFRKSYRTCNQDSDIRDEDTFRKEIRYDIVYHLLRNGPIFASGQTVRYKRKREYYPRGVKKRIKFTK
jgi:hypothetical protein